MLLPFEPFSTKLVTSNKRFVTNIDIIKIEFGEWGTKLDICEVAPIFGRPYNDEEV